MAQQINLLTPILLTPRRLFSAVTMLQSLALVILGGLLIGGWTTWQARQARLGQQADMVRLQAEQKTLLEATTQLPAPTDPKAVDQLTQSLLQQNERQRSLLAALAGGQLPEGERHSDLLRLLAQSAPRPVWLSEARWAQGRLELVGATLDTAVLREWLARLAAHPLLKGQQLSAVTIEKWAADGSTGRAGLAGPSGQATPLPTALAGSLQAWRFRVVSETPKAASAAAAASSAASSVLSEITLKTITDGGLLR